MCVHLCFDLWHSQADLNPAVHGRAGPQQAQTSPALGSAIAAGFPCLWLALIWAFIGLGDAQLQAGGADDAAAGQARQIGKVSVESL